MTKLRKMPGGIKQPKIVRLTRMIKTQSKEKLTSTGTAEEEESE